MYKRFSKIVIVLNIKTTNCEFHIYACSRYVVQNKGDVLEENNHCSTIIVIKTPKRFSAVNVFVCRETSLELGILIPFQCILFSRAICLGMILFAWVSLWIVCLSVWHLISLFYRKLARDHETTQLFSI